MILNINIWFVFNTHITTCYYIITPSYEKRFNDQYKQAQDKQELSVKPI
jgi:hypothetical protein